MSQSSCITDTVKRRLQASWKQCHGANHPTEVLCCPKGSTHDNARELVTMRMSEKWTNYSQKANRRPSDGGCYLQYRCRRFRKPGESSKIAVGCTAYISYKIIKDPILGMVVLERVNDHHVGHDIDSCEEKHILTVCKELDTKITAWFELEVPPHNILIKCHEWALEKGHTDYHDARYFVTPDQIKALKKKYMRSKQMDEDDLISMEKIIEDRRGDVVYYQPFIFNEQNLICVLQTEEMKADMEQSTSKMIFMDATGSVNQYGFPLWSIIMTNKFGRGVPVAHIIVSAETRECLEVALGHLRDQCGMNPRTVMVDKDYKEIMAVETVWPLADVLLCFFHLLQAVHRWLISKNSTLQGTQNGLLRNDVIHFFARMKQCASKDDFNTTADEFRAHFGDHQGLLWYFDQNWYPIAHMWAMFGRLHNHENANTNNLAERFFLRLKRQLFNGRQNRRLDALVLMLLNKAVNFFTVMHNLREVGRISDDKAPQTKLPALAAQDLLAKGWADKVINIDYGNYIVPSEFDLEVAYHVNLPDCECMCEASKSTMCKHICLVRKLQLDQYPGFSTLEADCASAAEALRHNEQMWLVEQGKITIRDPDFLRPIVADSDKCTCRAYSFLCDCAHVRLATIILHEHRLRFDMHTNSDEQGLSVPDIAVEDTTAESCSDSNIGNPDTNFHQMLNDIVLHYNSEENMPTQSQKELLKKLHNDIFLQKQPTRNLKYKPLFPGRRMKRLHSNERSETDTRRAKRQKVIDRNKNDHTMAKPQGKEKLPPAKMALRVTSNKRQLPHSRAPSIRTLVKRNKDQSTEVTIANMTLTLPAANYLKAQSVLPTPDNPLHITLLSGIVERLKMMSAKTLEYTSNDTVLQNVKHYLTDKFQRSSQELLKPIIGPRGSRSRKLCMNKITQ